MWHTDPVNAIAAPHRTAAETDWVYLCCGCQRQRVGLTDFVTLLVPPAPRERVSHTLCPECAESYYGVSRERYVAVVRDGAAL